VGDVAGEAGEPVLIAGFLPLLAILDGTGVSSQWSMGRPG